MTEKINPMLFCWSGGKDSAVALHVLGQQGEVRVAVLLTTVTEGYERISMHGVRRALLVRQAAAIGLPLHEGADPAGVRQSGVRGADAGGAAFAKSGRRPAGGVRRHLSRRICASIASEIWRR